MPYGTGSLSVWLGATRNTALVALNEALHTNGSNLKMALVYVDDEVKYPQLESGIASMQSPATTHTRDSTLKAMEAWCTPGVCCSARLFLCVWMDLELFRIPAWHD